MYTAVLFYGICLYGEIMESYKNESKRAKKQKVVEDADSLKVRLNRLIEIGQNIIWLLIGIAALLLGIFIASIVYSA